MNYYCGDIKYQTVRHGPASLTSVPPKVRWQNLIKRSSDKLWSPGKNIRKQKNLCNKFTGPGLVISITLTNLYVFPMSLYTLHKMLDDFIINFIAENSIVLHNENKM